MDSLLANKIFLIIFATSLWKTDG